MPYSLHPPIKKETATYSIVKKAFTKDECQHIMELSDQIPAETGMTAAVPTKRISDIRWVHWQPGVDSIFQKLGVHVLEVNSRWWNFNLGSFWEPLQLTHYKSDEKGHYSWHADRSDVGISMNRKISGTLLLNDSFEGGDFELFNVSQSIPMEQGDLLLFPSYEVHRVKPVTSADRWSLVFWVSGPAFA